jgi:hypothetical protein
MLQKASIPKKTKLKRGRPKNSEIQYPSEDF